MAEPILIQPNDLTDTVQVANPSDDVNMPTLLHPATTFSEQGKEINNVSPVSEDFFFQSVTHPIELRQMQMRRDSPELQRHLTYAKHLWHIHDIWPSWYTPLPNNLELPPINAVVHELKELALQAHSDVENQTSECIVCGKSYQQVIGETAASFLHSAAELWETTRELDMKKQALLAGLQSNVITFISREVSQVVAFDGIIYSINNGDPTKEPQRKFLPLLQDKSKSR